LTTNPQVARSSRAGRANNFRETGRQRGRKFGTLEALYFPSPRMTLKEKLEHSGSCCSRFIFQFRQPARNTKNSQFEGRGRDGRKAEVQDQKPFDYQWRRTSLGHKKRHKYYPNFAMGGGEGYTTKYQKHKEKSNLTFLFDGNKPIM